MIIWLDVPWNPNRMMYAIVKWSRPFFASIAKCGSMAQHSGILGRSIGWIRPGCGFEDVRRVEMGWDGFFVSPNDFHHCQHEPPKPIGRVNVQLADFVFFPHHFTMILKMLVLFDSMSIQNSFLWPFQPHWGGLITRLARSTAKRCDAIWPAPENFQCRILQNVQMSRSISLWRVLWRVPLGANGCHLTVMFQGLDEDTWKSEKGDDYKAQGVFWGSKNHLWRVLSQMDI